MNAGSPIACSFVEVSSIRGGSDQINTSAKFCIIIVYFDFFLLLHLLRFEYHVFCNSRWTTDWRWRSFRWQNHWHGWALFRWVLTLILSFSILTQGLDSYFCWWIVKCSSKFYFIVKLCSQCLHSNFLSTESYEWITSDEISPEV